MLHYEIIVWVWLQCLDGRALMEMSVCVFIILQSMDDSIACLSSLLMTGGGLSFVILHSNASGLVFRFQGHSEQFEAAFGDGGRGGV